MFFQLMSMGISKGLWHAKLGEKPVFMQVTSAHLFKTQTEWATLQTKLKLDHGPIICLAKILLGYEYGVWLSL